LPTAISSTLSSPRTRHNAKPCGPAAEIAFATRPFVDTDIAVALPDVNRFLTDMTEKLAQIDPAATELVVAHLGDGNIHYTAYPSSDAPALKDRIKEAVEDTVQTYNGSFSAEHGVGISKLNTMTRRKNPTALVTMRAIKSALDPHNILNPGKTIPPAACKKYLGGNGATAPRGQRSKTKHVLRPNGACRVVDFVYQCRNRHLDHINDHEWTYRYAYHHTRPFAAGCSLRHPA
jgi:hypothetical protein